MKYSEEQIAPEKSRVFPGERIFMSRRQLTITNGKADVWYQYLGDPTDLTNNDIKFMLNTAPQKMPKILIDQEDLAQWRKLNNIDNQQKQSNRVARKVRNLGKPSEQ
jgi:hypothetical protein